MSVRRLAVLIALLSASVGPSYAQHAAVPPEGSKPAPAANAASLTKEQKRIAALKEEAAREIDGLATLTQQKVDSVFSFGELGFQEVEVVTLSHRDSRAARVPDHAGRCRHTDGMGGGVGSGKPVIALGSDIDGIPQASQKLGVAYRDPLINGAPGHGEGHNSGIPLNITAAIVVKAILDREKLPGTLRLWPGVAEELLGSKAWFVRDGLFKDVDISLFSHVSDKFGTSWGERHGTGLVSIEYTFTGGTAHSAVLP